MRYPFIPRRTFLQELGLTAGMICTLTGKAKGSKARSSSRLHLASNQYSWITYYRRENRDFNASLDEGLKDVATSGLDGLEALITSPEQIDQLAPLLRKHGLEMRSLYVNTTLHEPLKAKESIEYVITVGVKAKKAMNTRIIVTNPSPIRWGGTEDKSDEQLRVQARHLDELGRELSLSGLKLAYHNHDMELRNAAREFHHMMVGTDPEHVTLCLDCHWIFRGSGNSSVALFDVLALYGSRVSELHLRQSIDGVWSETFGEGDIDYEAVARHLARIGIKPHLVLEQAVEEGTPKTMGPVEANRRSCEYARRVFG